MAWEDVIPAKGAHDPRNSGVRLAWRHNTSKGRPILALSIGHYLAQEIGWLKGKRLSVQRDREAHLLRLSLTENANTGWAINSKNGTLCVNIGLRDTDADKHDAEPAPFERDGDALIVKLPDWLGRPQRHAPPVSTMPKPAPAPMPAAQPLAIRPAVQPSGAVRAAPIRPAHNTKEILKAPPGPKDAAPPDAQDEREAKILLRNGASVRAVAEEFGQPFEIIRKWADEVRAA